MDYGGRALSPAMIPRRVWRLSLKSLSRALCVAAVETEDTVSRPLVESVRGAQRCNRRIVDLGSFSPQTVGPIEELRKSEQAFARPANSALIAKDADNQGAKALKPVAATIMQLAKVA